MKITSEVTFSPNCRIIYIYNTELSAMENNSIKIIVHRYKGHLTPCPGGQESTTPIFKVIC